MVKSINRFRQVVLFLGLTCLPLFYIPGFIIPFEIPKVMFVYIWGSMVSILTLVEMIAGGKIEKVGKEIYLAGIWMALMFVSSWWGVDPAKSWWGNYFRWDGLMTYIILFTIFVVLNLSDKKKWLDSALTGVALSSILSAIWAVTQLIAGRGAGFDGYGAGFGQPVFLAGYLLVTAPLVWLKVKNSIFRKPVAIIMLLGLLATKTLAVYFCLPLIILVLLNINKKVSINVAGLIFGLFVLGVTGIYIGQVNKGILAGGLDYEGRGRIFAKAFLAFREKPILGWGVANFDRAFDEKIFPQKLNNDVYVDKAHSSLVEIAVTGGILGLTAYLTFVGCVLNSLRKRRDNLGKYLFLTLIVYLIHSQTNIISVNEELLFWLVAAGASMR